MTEQQLDGVTMALCACWNCDDGYVEVDIGDDNVIEELDFEPCEVCLGKGSFWVNSDTLCDEANVIDTHWCRNADEVDLLRAGLLS
ncbi:MAG: hypothetical protein AAF384_19670 [Pseudomonadota bacterium]